jgi:hypothetical protein
MPKKTRAEHENKKNEAQAYVDKGAKALGRAKSLEVVVDILLDIKEVVESVDTKLDTIISNQ